MAYEGFVCRPIIRREDSVGPASVQPRGSRAMRWCWRKTRSSNCEALLSGRAPDDRVLATASARAEELGRSLVSNAAPGTRRDGALLPVRATVSARSRAGAAGFEGAWAEALALGS